VCTYLHTHTHIQTQKHTQIGHAKLDSVNVGKYYGKKLGVMMGAEKVLVQKSGYFARKCSVPIDIYIYICIFVCMCVCMYVSVCVCACVCVCLQAGRVMGADKVLVLKLGYFARKCFVYVYVYIYMYVYIYIYVYIYACIYTYINVCVYVCICVCACVCIQAGSDICIYI